MVKTTKNIKAFALILLTSALLLMAITPNLPSVKAQTQATVVMFTAVGGTTTPTGTTTYAAGTIVPLAATAGDGFYFSNWVIVTAAGGYTDYNNPTSITVNASTEYAVQAIFDPIQSVPSVAPTQPETLPTLVPDTTTSPDLSHDAIVVVVAGVGGTTTPAPGTYALANATSLDLTATANTGFTFSHWVIGGTPLSHGAYAFTDTPTQNPYNVNHGYGYTYSYQPVFNAISPATSPTPTPKIDEFSSAAAIIIAMVLVIVAFGAYTFTKKAKK